MPLSFTREVAKVPAAVDAFLSQRVERNVVASLLVHARAGLLAGSGTMFAWGTGDRGEVLLYATRTPGWPLLVSELGHRDAQELVERWLEEDPSVPGVTGVPQVAGTARIGPVYTPPEHRCHGYASAAVAAACRAALARGAHQCMLFTDLANATSNRIYAAVGFRRVGDWEEIEFKR